MIPRKNLLDILSRRTGVDMSEFQDLVEDPFVNPAAPCILWPGAMGGRSQTTPMTKLAGRVVYIRSALGGQQSRVVCGNPRCISPLHIS